MVKTENFKFTDSEGVSLNCYRWEKEHTDSKGIIQLSHGMSENIFRYDEFAKILAENGYIVYGHDHRGHGETAETLDDIGYMHDDDNFKAMVKNLREVNEYIKTNHPNLPIILFGHSMGSFISQKYISMYGNELHGVILSGTNGKQSSIVNFGIVLSYIEMKIKGRTHRSSMIDKLSFGSFNKKFDPVRTNFDWLSRNEHEVDKYLANPYCGVTFTSSYFYDFMRGLKDIHKKETLETIPKDLPIFIFAGDKDPVGYEGKGIINLYNMYKDLKIKNVNYKLYKDGRHEMLNEINKTEVINDILCWIKSLN
ncbi:alpha/beta hydrolase [Clostridium hydrogeniformans]|uniref:alpha/beta hydrolase n=1 Tax=Clostridium hydrogeniformans TaxID=349933 RepID=UPI00048920C0|nr:alpha/beta hydrolase [Clostridium hydrogeniformans]